MRMQLWHLTRQRLRMLLALRMEPAARSGLCSLKMAEGPRARLGGSSCCRPAAKNFHSFRSFHIVSFMSFTSFIRLILPQVGRLTRGYECFAIHNAHSRRGCISSPHNQPLENWNRSPANCERGHLNGKFHEMDHERAAKRSKALAPRGQHAGMPLIILDGSEFECDSVVGI